MATLQCIKLVDNDWDIVGGRTVILTDKAALAQRLQNKLTLWLGEWYQDTTQGIDWIGILNLPMFQQRRLNAVIIEVLLGDPDVQSVIKVSSTIDTDQDITVTYNVQSTFGTITGTTTTGTVNT